MFAVARHCVKQYCQAISVFAFLNMRRISNSLNLQLKSIYSLKEICIRKPRPKLMLSSPNLKVVREKYTKKKAEQLDDLEEVDEENEWEHDPSDKDSRIMKVKVNSLRTDLIVKAGTGTARNKVETLFYDSKIRVNGMKVFKKSSQLKVGDEVDIIRGPSLLNPDFIMVSRVEILSASEIKDGTLTVRLRRIKSLTIENYADPWKGVLS